MDIFLVATRLILAAILGAVIGIEREIKNRAAGFRTRLSAAIGLAVGIGYYEGAIIATVICLVTLISLNKISDLINKKTIKSYSMIFDTYNFNQGSFYEFTSK